MRRLGQHPLLQVLSNNKGNPRTLVLIEPLWGIPYNLIAPFATLYMYTQGVTDVQIGLILSITMFVQVFFSFFGGILADKLGRKFTTMLGDFFGWAVACLVWSVSNNFWLFLAAALLNCFEQINQTAWYCLLIEDAQPKDLIGIYTWVNIGGLVAIFFAPPLRAVCQRLLGGAGGAGAVLPLCPDHADQVLHHLQICLCVIKK